MTQTTQSRRLTLTIQEAMKLTGLSYGTVRNRISEGRLEAVRTGGRGSRILITMSSFEKFLEGHRSGNSYDARSITK